MISVIIPTLNAAPSLARTLSSLLDANKHGMIREVIVSDAGSEDATREIAEEAGAFLVGSQKGRGHQLNAGAAHARGDWLLFLHADTRLEQGWEGAAQKFMSRSYEREAAVFRLKFDARGIAPWMVATGANLRARFIRLPFGDQGLLISRRHYQRLGGHKKIPLFEDVDIVRRIVRDGGRRALRVISPQAITSADRYVVDGYFQRVMRNTRCLSLYFSGVAPEKIAEIYYGRQSKIAHRDGKTALGRAGEDTPQP